MAEEREKHIAVQDGELKDLRHQIEMLRIEAASRAELAAHADEMRGLVKTLQKQQGRGVVGEKSKVASKRRSRPQG